MLAAARVGSWRARDRCYRMVPMAWSRKVWTAFLIGTAALATAVRTLAQALGPPPIFPVEISGTQAGTRIDLFGPGGRTVCGERCVLTLPQASYKMVVTDAEGHQSTQYLRVEMPTSAAVTPSDRGTRNLSIVLMSVGLAGVAVGYATFLVILFTKWVETAGYCAGDCPTHDFATSTYVIAGASLGAGLAVGLAGVVMWRRNHHATVRVDPLGAPPVKDDARLRLTPAAGLRWVGLGLTGRF